MFAQSLYTEDDGLRPVDSSSDQRGRMTAS
jgi:hypothetical protein